MSEQPENQAGESAEGASDRSEWAPAAADQPAPGPVASAFGSEDGGTAAAGDRPEIAVGAAFAGGFVLAMILRRLAR